MDFRAAGVLLIGPADGEWWVLCTREFRSEKEPNHLHLPGGRREVGESVNDTVVREVWEECGFDITHMVGSGKEYQITSGPRGGNPRYVLLVIVADTLQMTKAVAGFRTSEAGVLGVELVRWASLKGLAGRTMNGGIYDISEFLQALITPKLTEYIDKTIEKRRTY